MGGVLWMPKVLQDEVSFSYVLFKLFSIATAEK